MFLTWGNYENPANMWADPYGSLPVVFLTPGELWCVQCGEVTAGEGSCPRCGGKVALDARLFLRPGEYILLQGK